MTIPIRKLGSRGVNKDLPDYDLEATEFTHVKNVVFRDGAVAKALGHEQFTTTAVNPSWMEVWLADGVPEMVVAAQGDLYRLEGNILTNINGIVGSFTSSSTWQSTVFGDSVIFNNGIEPPQVFDAGETAFQDLPFWPDNYSAKIVRSFKSFLIALQVTIDGEYHPNLISWSDEAPTNELPLSWDVTDPTVLAGDNPLEGSDGNIVDGHTMGDNFIVYTQKAAHMMAFIGFPFVFAFRRLPFEGGLIGRDCAVEFDHKHFCVGIDNIYVHDGNTKMHVAEDRVQNEFYSELSNSTLVKVTKYEPEKEIWIHYATKGNTTHNRALIWSWVDNTWTFRDLPGVYCIKHGPVTPSSVSWATVTNSWNANSLRWSDYDNRTDQPFLIGLSSDDQAVHLLERSFFANGADFEAEVERTGIDLDEAFGKSHRMKMLTRIYPQIKGAGVVQFQLGYSMTPKSSVTWLPAIDYDVENDYKVDVRITGRYLAYRIKSTGSGTWRLSGLELEIVEAGRR